MGAAQAGKLQRAREIAEGGLLRGGDVVALNAFLGMIRARSGDTAGAISHLRAAHRGCPDDATIIPRNALSATTSPPRSKPPSAISRARWSLPA